MRDIRKVKNKYELRLDNRQLALLFAAGLLIFILLFTLGVMVGRDWSEWEQSRKLALPSEQEEIAQVGEEDLFKEEITALTEAISEKKLGEEPISSTGEITPSPEAPKELEYTFYETLPKKEPVKTKLEIPPEKEIKGEDTIAEEPAPKKEPVAAPILSSTGEYTIQVSSFTERGKATDLVNKLIRKKYPAYITSIQISQKTWYRVRVGHFTSREEAEKFANLLKDKEKLNAFITPNTK